MTRLLSLCALTTLVACGGAPATPQAPGGGPGGGDIGTGAPRVGNPVDALWELAPSDTVIGMVVAPGTTMKLYDMAAELLRVIEARPLGASLTAEARQKVSELPFDIFDQSAFAAAGIDLGRGAALFLDPQEEVTIVLPVTDREAFRSFTKATVETLNGMSYDRFDDDMACTDRGKLYVCMRTPEELAAAAKAGPSDFATRVYRLPGSYRGDAEMVMDLVAFEKMEGEADEDFRELFSDYGLLAAVVQMGRGSLTARAWVQGTPRGDMKAVADASSGIGSVSTSVAKLLPSSLARFIVPMQLVDKEIPDESLPGGLSLKKDITGNMTGEFVAYAPSSKKPWGRIAFGIRDPKPFRDLLSMGCAMVPPMDFLKVSSGENRCDFVVDWEKVPNLDAAARTFFTGPLDLSVGVEDDKVALTIGKESPVVESTRLSAIGRELLEKEWSYSFWTQNFSVISGLDGPWSKVLAEQPADMQDGMRYGLWLMSHVSEFATAISMQPDGMHMMAHIGTYAADADAPYAAYQAAVTKNIDVGDTTGEFKAIRDRWPESQAAQQSAMNSPFSVIFAKMVAEISVPAYVKYLERSAEGTPVVPVAPGFEPKK